MRGRRPDPPALQAAKGNPGRRPVSGKAVLSDEAIVATAPAWISAAARAIWDRLAPDLSRMHLLARPDAATFGRYCEWFAHWLTANEALRGGSLVVRTTSEHVEMDRLNKHLQAALLIEKRLVDMEDRFGLNPANRQRIFAQRAASGAGSQAPLFGEAPDGSDAALPPSPPAPSSSPIGLLN